MPKGKSGGHNNNYKKFLNALSHEDAVRILLDLCNDSVLADRIGATVKTLLAKVDADAIADEIFRSLNAIQVEDLWDHSGETRWGYQDPTDVAFEMIENEVQPFVFEMEKFKSLGMKKGEKECCKGIILGLLRYGEEGSNEFRDWAPDDPYTVAENIVYDWKKDHLAEDVKEIQAVYDGYFSDKDEDED